MADNTRDTNWTLRLIGGAILVVLLLLGYWISVALVPREWAQFIGDRVDGRLLRGWFYGLFIGFVFTLLPLVIARQAFRPLGWGLRGVLLLVAVLTALPNLMTLGIRLGSGNAAHAGERILDVEGPGFRAGTSWGIATAIIVFLALSAFGVWRHFGDRESKELRRARAAAGE